MQCLNSSFFLKRSFIWLKKRGAGTKVHSSTYRSGPTPLRKFKNGMEKNRRDLKSAFDI